MRSTRARTIAALATATAGALLITTQLPAAQHASANPAQRATTVRAPHTPATAPVARVGLDTQGSPSLHIQREGREVLRSSPMGLTTTTSNCAYGLTPSRITPTRTVDQHYTTVTGKRLAHHYLATEQRFTFRGPSCNGLTITVRVSHDAVAYRYTLPRTQTITAENSAFRVRPDARAWLQEFSVEYENTRRATSVTDAREAYEAFPALFRSGPDKDPDYLMLTESGVDGHYSASRLLHAGGGDYRLALPQPQTRARATPWRLAIVGDANDVVSSDAVTDLAAPSRVKDASWVQPGTVAWSWWSDPDSPKDYATQRRWVDYAAKHKMPYSLVDWHWTPSWMPRLVDYARKRGVKILVWADHDDLATVRQRDRLLPLWKKWGVAGVKIDFISSDRQPAMRWYDDVLRQTADLHLMVSFHGTTAPRGLQRTWPQLMTSEAVRGEEYYQVTGNNSGLTPQHNVMLAFTRNVVGSMDYTPTVFSKGAVPHATTSAHELALAVAYESGWQCFGDDLASYDAHPQAQRLIDTLPAAWDDTRLLAGDPDQYAVVARRRGHEWYVGVIGAGDARTVKVPTEALGSHAWNAEVYKDGNGSAVDRTTHRVDSGATIDLPLRENGGAVIKLTPTDSGREQR
ncbi:glycoside hydrolase family 97 catalytic domain-containing protein [Streptomyces sp. NPDC001661]